jgi:hypothetical protein
MRLKWEKWLREGIHTFTKSGKMRRATYIEICQWIVDVWNEITPICIKNGFKRAELNCYENEETQENSESETDSDTEIEDNDCNYLENYREIFESFQIESDEEFEGFN